MDLVKLERKAFRNRHQTGLRFMFPGVLILSMGIIPLMESLGVHRYYGYLLFMGLPLALFLFIDNKICKPRLGYVKFSPSRRLKMRHASYFTGGISGGILILLFVTIYWKFPASFSNAIGEWGFIVLLATICLAIFAAVGSFMEDKRYILIGIVFAISFPLDELLQKFVHSPWDNLIIYSGIGATLIVIGGIDFAQFIKNTNASMNEVEMIDDVN